MVTRPGPGGLAEALRGHVPAASVVDRAALEDALTALQAAARGAWPDITIAPEVFVRFLAERLPPGEDVLAGLSRLHAADLYLACGCALGDEAAVTAFERRVLPQVGPALTRAKVPRPLADEVKQILRIRLLVPDGGEPRITGYSGRGALVRWVQIGAMRQALILGRRRKTHGELDGSIDLELHAAGPDPELDYLKTRYAAEFTAAFRAALAALPRRDRNVLRLHFVHALNIEQIGVVYHVHRATVARWIGHAREALLRDTRGALGARLQLRPEELDSLLDLVRSRLDVSLSTLGVD
ncbi:MAG TPA: sigma factor-like helix-turn-helix DNA-binding protein [Polyangia bacterium]|jgi:RNA polymerase sigma-70 factor (ECF subfamily)